MTFFKGKEKSDAHSLAGFNFTVLSQVSGYICVFVHHSMTKKKWSGMPLSACWKGHAA